MTDLNHSLVLKEPESSNLSFLAVEHAKTLQAISSCKVIIELALKNYETRQKNGAAPSDLLWILQPAIINVQKILQGLANE